MLDEEAGDVLAFGGERFVDGRRDQHFDDRLLRPTILAGIEIGLFEILKRRADYDARAVMFCEFAGFGWSAGKVRQGIERDQRARGNLTKPCRTLSRPRSERHTHSR